MLSATQAAEGLAQQVAGGGFTPCCKGGVGGPPQKTKNNYLSDNAFKHTFCPYLGKDPVAILSLDKVSLMFPYMTIGKVPWNNRTSFPEKSGKSGYCIIGKMCLSVHIPNCFHTKKIMVVYYRKMCTAYNT